MSEVSIGAGEPVLGSALLTGLGPRSTEAALLGDSRRILDEAALALRDGLEPRHWPLLIVVPSRSLRQHLLERFASSGCARLGLEVATLFTVAQRLVADFAPMLPAAEPFLEVLAGRVAIEEDELNGVLERFAGADGVLAATLRDLLDAGFDPAHQEAALECLGEADASLASQERAAALIKSAARLDEVVAELGLERRGDLLERGVEALQRGGHRFGAVFIHGFAETTAVAADLIQALISRATLARVYLDTPEDPAQPGSVDSGALFTERLAARLAQLPVSQLEPEGVARIDLVEARGRDAEAGAAARFFAEALAAGVAPERCGLVCRELESWAPRLARALEAFGLPFSGVGASSSGDGVGRRLAGLAELLRRRHEVELELLLDLVEHPEIAEQRTPIRAFLRQRRLGRWHDLSGLDLAAEPERIPLDLVAGNDGTSKQRLHLDRRHLLAFVDTVVALAGRLGVWPARASLGRYAQALEELVCEGLLWDVDDPARTLLSAELAGLPVGQQLGARELVAVLAPLLDKASRRPFGGAGGGIAVLSVTEARARSFDRLAVVGCERGSIPAAPRRDPLLGDSLRLALRTVLPELPVKSEGAEERYLFAQLLGSAESVLLSWPGVDDDGEPVVRSPFIDRLLAGRPGLEIRRVPSRLPGPRFEAVEAALAADPEGFERALGRQLDAAGAAAPEEVARGSAQVFAAAWGLGLEIGPWDGLLGRGERRNKTAVTEFEAMARCAWKLFVERRLGLVPLPEALARLPEVDGGLLGRVVHEVLEAVAGGRGAGAELRSWPDGLELEGLLRRAVTRQLRLGGLEASSLAPVIEGRARELLEIARQEQWPQPQQVLGVELEESVALGSAVIDYRVDLALAAGDSGRELVDYKTGKPPSELKTAKSQRKHLLAEIASGRRLQAAVYAATGARGRYLHLRPDLAAEHRNVCVEAGDDELLEAASKAVATLVGARELGVWPAQAALQKSGRSCEYCAVRQACHRDDPSRRRRLQRLLGGDTEGGRGLALARQLAGRVGS